MATQIIDRLDNLVDCWFGIPGDYVLNFYKQLSDRIRVVNTTDEQSAGFAADAYARVNGFGVVVATYCVGGFKLVNAIAGAYAERSPVLFISGSPGVRERDTDMLLHHMVGPFECQHRVFRNITCASAVLDDPTMAGYLIDEVIEAIKHFKQPGYIELPRDLIDKNIKYDAFTQGTPVTRPSKPENLEEALEKTKEWVSRSKNPVILAGVEIARFGLGKKLIAFAERHSIPIATTLLGKSVVSEKHPLFIGTYAGGMSVESVRKAVEDSDCILMLGVMQTDMNMAFKPFQCDQTNVILASTHRVRIRRSTYERVRFVDFTEGLLSANFGNRKKMVFNRVAHEQNKFVAKTDAKMTTPRLFEKINSILTDDMAIIADVGDSLFGAADLTVHHSNQFVCPAFYASMGFAVPAALGVQCAQASLRPIVIVGDGAFQMTGMEFSTIVREGLTPIIFVLNNAGFGTERLLIDGKFNDVQKWNFERIPEIVGGGKGFLVKTEGDLELAVSQALDYNGPSIINVVVDKNDATPALRRMMESLSRKV